MKSYERCEKCKWFWQYYIIVNDTYLQKTHGGLCRHKKSKLCNCIYNCPYWEENNVSPAEKQLKIEHRIADIAMQLNNVRLIFLLDKNNNT